MRKLNGRNSPFGSGPEGWCAVGGVNLTSPRKVETVSPIDKRRWSKKSQTDRPKGAADESSESKDAEENMLGYEAEGRHQGGKRTPDRKRKRA